MLKKITNFILIIFLILIPSQSVLGGPLSRRGDLWFFTTCEQGNEFPRASFIFSKEIVEVDEIFQAISTSTDLEDDQASIPLQIRWDWDVSNGINYDTSWITQTAISYQYPKSGYYSITLEVKDSCGQTTQAQRQIRVVGYAANIVSAKTFDFSLEASQPQPQADLKSGDNTYLTTTATANQLPFYSNLELELDYLKYQSTPGIDSITVTSLSDYGIVISFPFPSKPDWQEKITIQTGQEKISPLGKYSLNFKATATDFEGDKEERFSGEVYFYIGKRFLGEFEIINLAALGCDTIGISWEKAAEAEGYRIFRKKVGEDYLEKANILSDDLSNCPSAVDNCSFTDTSGIEPNTTYLYYIQTYTGSETMNNKVKTENCSKQAIICPCSGGTEICPHQVTTPLCRPEFNEPEGGGVSSPRCGQIEVKWKEQTGASGYNIKKGLGHNKNEHDIVASSRPEKHPNRQGKFPRSFNLEKNCRGDWCTFIDENIIPRKNYYYHLTVDSVGGESAPSDSIGPVFTFCFKGPRWRER
jgi:hypothetical protein